MIKEKILKYIQFVLMLLLYFILPSCGEKSKDNTELKLSLADTSFVNNEIRKILGNELKFVLIGNFDKDTLKEAAAGVEIMRGNEWGIKFLLFKVEKNHLIKVYETNLLEGSFRESFVKKVSLPNYSYELLYYNSQDYFWGSGGGEVFTYLIDFEKHKTNYAHLFAEARSSIQLYFSKEITDKEVKDFVLNNLKEDYPGLKIASEDVSLDY